MTELFVRLYTDPIIHKVCEPIFNIDDSLIELVGKMSIIMIQNKGVGLAAPQIGISKQLAIMNLNDNLVTMINPVILEKSKHKVKMQEGCLSAPKILVTMKRSDSLVVRYTDLKGNELVNAYTDFNARVIQHEIDHLLGVCIVDKLPK